MMEASDYDSGFDFSSGLLVVLFLGKKDAEVFKAHVLSCCSDFPFQKSIPNDIFWKADS